jgi:hypothetical protein
MRSSESVGETTQSVLTDPAASDWVNSALRTAMAREPVDALNDAFALVGLLEERLKSVLELTED